MAARYERVTFRAPTGRKRTVLLGDVAESTTEHPATGPIRFLGGVEVGEDGDIRWSDGGTTMRRHLISLDAITDRVPLRMDNVHAVLVEES